MVKNLKVLLVDDEPDFRDVLGAFLKHRHISYESAGGCLEAFEWLGRAQFNVVLMDVIMPGLDGIKCMVEIKKLYPTLPVIILTGNASISTGIMSMKEGAFDFCMKPVDFSELIEKIILAGEENDGELSRI